MQLARIEPGRTAQEALQALRERRGALPPWATLAGGPNAHAPGEQAAATLHLTPGEYLVVCLMPDMKGTSHVSLGMHKTVMVEGQPAVRVSRRKPDLTIKQSDYAFSLPLVVRAGKHNIQVANRGTQPHEVVMVHLAEKKTVKDFAMWQPLVGGPAPGKPIGGITGLPAGGQATFFANLSPGRYGVICYFPHEATRTPHFAHGMMAEFTVE
jgi:hypothetical protein